MAAFDPGTLDRWRALAIVDRDGSTVGTISEFYLDRETGHPTWALVNTGLFGSSQSFVPLVHATEISDGLQVPYEKRHIKDAPRVDLHDELTPEEEAALFAHYGVDYGPSTEPPAAEAPAPGTPAAANDGDLVPGEPPGPVAADPDQGPGEVPGGIPVESGSTDPTAVVEGEGGSQPAEATEALHVPHEPVEADGGHHPPDTDPVTAGIPDEPGTATPDEPGRTDQDEAGPEDPMRAEAGLGGDGPEAQPPPGQLRDGSDAPPDLDQLRDRPTDSDAAPDRDQLRDGPVDPDRNRLKVAPADPDLGRTAPVEPGLPGSTAASPYGTTATVDKGAVPSDPSADEPPRAPREAAWAPATAESFEEHDPVDPPAGAGDRWREAKLTAERDRIARATAAQPEERSPLERARRRLERLVGVGQEPADQDEISPADREAAERARRARLGLDEEDQRRRGPPGRRSGGLGHLGRGLGQPPGRRRCQPPERGGPVGHLVALESDRHRDLPPDDRDRVASQEGLVADSLDRVAEPAVDADQQPGNAPGGREHRHRPLARRDPVLAAPHPPHRQGLLEQRPRRLDRLPERHRRVLGCHHPGRVDSSSRPARTPAIPAAHEPTPTPRSRLAPAGPAPRVPAPVRSHARARVLVPVRSHAHHRAGSRRPCPGLGTRRLGPSRRLLRRRAGRGGRPGLPAPADRLDPEDVPQPRADGRPDHPTLPEAPVHLGRDQPCLDLSEVPESTAMRWSVAFPRL